MSQPVPGTGRSRWSRRRSRGVSANSRIVQHVYGKGPWLHRLVRRREEKLWRREEGQ